MLQYCNIFQKVTFMYIFGMISTGGKAIPDLVCYYALILKHITTEECL